MSDIEKHKRVHNMLLGPLERPALQWLSSRMPAWMNPDILTLIGVVGSIIIFAGYALTNTAPAYLWLASLGFVVNWFGDSLDGTLARYRKIERPRYGFFVDHTVDSFSMVLIFVGLGISAYVRLEIALVACIGYLLMSILVYVGAFVSGEFKISYARIGPTELRVFVVLVNAWIYFSGNSLINLGGFAITLFDLVLSVIATLLFAFFTVNSISQASHWRSIDR